MPRLPSPRATAISSLTLLVLFTSHPLVVLLLATLVCLLVLWPRCCRQDWLLRPCRWKRGCSMKGEECVWQLVAIGSGGAGTVSLFLVGRGQLAVCTTLTDPALLLPIYHNNTGSCFTAALAPMISGRAWPRSWRSASPPSRRARTQCSSSWRGVLALCAFESCGCCNSRRGRCLCEAL